MKIKLFNIHKAFLYHRSIIITIVEYMELFYVYLSLPTYSEGHKDPVPTEPFQLVPSIYRCLINDLGLLMVTFQQSPSRHTLPWPKEVPTYTQKLSP